MQESSLCSKFTAVNLGMLHFFLQLTEGEGDSERDLNFKYNSLKESLHWPKINVHRPCVRLLCMLISFLKAEKPEISLPGDPLNY